MPLDVGIVGLPGAGKTTLFTGLTSVSQTAYGQEHVGVASIPDERLEPIAQIESSAKTTPATVKLVDPPGLSAAVLGELRKADALLAVLRGFGPEADPSHDLETIGLELVVADRDHVEKRLERVRTMAKGGDPRVRDEAAELERILAHVEDGRPLSVYERELPPELAPLTTKPVVQIVNGDGGIDLKLEAELAELSPEHFDVELHRRAREHLLEPGDADRELVQLLAELDARADAEGIDEATTKELLLNLRERGLRRELQTADLERTKELQEALERLRTAATNLV
jgi:ribosome-binding ATPase YchF (GTP1/OBG family)